MEKTIQEKAEEISTQTRELKENIKIKKYTKEKMKTKEINDEVRRISQLINNLFN